MGAVPDPLPAAPAVVSAVPRRMRLICAVVAALVLAGLLLDAVVLEPTGVVKFHTSDHVAIGLLGLILAGGILFLGRPRVDADVTGVRVRNIIGSYALPWTVVRSVRFDPKSPWASLLLTSGEEITVLALQAMDRGRAADAVDGLRALLAVTKAATAKPRQPLLYPEPDGE